MQAGSQNANRAAREGSSDDSAQESPAKQRQVRGNLFEAVNLGKGLLKNEIFLMARYFADYVWAIYVLDTFRWKLQFDWYAMEEKPIPKVKLIYGYVLRFKNYRILFRDQFTKELEKYPLNLNQLS